MKTIVLLFGLCFCLSLFSLEKDDALFKAAESEQSAVLKTIEKLVKIESHTEDETGLTSMGHVLADRLEELGATVSRQKPAHGVAGENLVGRIKGRGGKNLLLMAHMDTVYPAGTLAKAPFKVVGNKAYGPGIGDDKAGIAVILHALRLMRQRGFTKFGTITVLFNTDEEQGSSGSSELIRRLAGENDLVFSFEPTTNPETLMLATSGIGAAYADFTGKAAHAGMNPEQGTNALVEAAEFVSRTTKFDEGPGKLRFNWTVASAGRIANIIPESAALRADVRYPDEAAFQKLQEELHRVANSPHLKNSRIDLRFSSGRPPFNANEGGKALVRRAVAIYESLGETIQVVPRIGGGTDAAFAAQSGKPVIEGLGLPGFGFHSNVGEFIYIDAIPRRLYLAVKLLTE